LALIYVAVLIVRGFTVVSFLSIYVYEIRYTILSLRGALLFVIARASLFVIARASLFVIARSEATKQSHPLPPAEL